MSKLLLEASRGAIAAVLPPIVTQPLPVAVESTPAPKPRRKRSMVTLRLLYDAFAPEAVESHELKWRKGTTLADYLEGLPTDCEWMIFHNGTEVEIADAAQISVEREDAIGLILVPQGGGGGIKGVLRIVLQAAAIALVAFAPGLGWAALAAINIGIGLINAFLLTPRPPKQKSHEETKSYGIDGAKNSATEGIPYPVLYGEFRQAGNFADCYTQNVGDDQYLYLRQVLSDGLIDSISDVEVNEQPLANFLNSETRVSLGSLTEGVNDWFPTSIRQINKGIKIDTGWVVHETTTAVDKVRFDVTFTNGLVKIKEKNGDYQDKSVVFETQYRVKGTGLWQPLGTSSWSSIPRMSLDPFGTGIDTNVATEETVTGVTGLRIGMTAPTAAVAAGASMGASIRPANSQVLTPIGSVTSADVDVTGYAFDPSADGSIAGPTDITPSVNQTFVADNLPEGDYVVLSTGAGGIASIEAKTAPTNGQVTVTDKRTRQIRKSFESIVLARAIYEVRIRRTTPTSTDQYQVDEVYLTDVAEIETTPVAMRGTANLSLKIKLNEQLNNIPGVTVKGKGAVVQKYDIEGNPTVKVWSNNPAWVALDILCGAERGAGMPTSRIDFPRWLELAQYCDDNNITFNGIFDTGTNIGDALQQVLRIGHATSVPFGTKISVAIDRKRDPVHLFTQGNIIKGTFAVTYMSVADRANEFEFSYYDKTDRNKQKTIRYVDPKAVTFNEVPRPAQISLIGVDNHEQAKRELWRAIYANRLLIRSVTFDAPMDAINLSIGEVALVQHDMMEWAKSGRLKDGSTTTQLVLDQLVTKDSGTYSVLIHYDAMLRGQSTVQSVVGRKVMIQRPAGANLNATQLASKRLIVGAKDYEIAEITNGTTYHTVTLNEAPTGIVGGQSCGLWDTDVLEERTVTTIATNAGGTTTVTLASALPSAPPQYANFVFGKNVNVRKPYALSGIKGSGLEKRTLTLVEYNEGVYGPAEVEIPIPTQNISDRNVAHVQALMFDFEQTVDPTRSLINARIHWNASGTINYAGADVYMAINGGAWRTLGSAVNVSEFHTVLSPKDKVAFKVVAYNARGDRAPFGSAPTIGGTIDVDYFGLDAPENVVATLASFEVTGTVDITWQAPIDPTNVTGYELQYHIQGSADWIGIGTTTALSWQLTGLAAHSYEIRVRSIGPNNQVSEWVAVPCLVSHPDINAAPVGLRLNGGEADAAYSEFGGRDAIFTWTDAVRDALHFLDYEVRIFTNEGALCSTHYATTPNFTYTYDQNVVDGAGTPRRTFTFDVRQRGRNGQLSASRVMIANNPAPVLQGLPVVTGAPDALSVAYVLPADTDLQGVKVYMSTASGFTVDATSLKYRGSSNPAVVPMITKGAEHYLIVVPFDLFGDGTASAEIAGLPLSIEPEFDTVAPEKVVGLTLSSSLGTNEDGTISATLSGQWTPSIASDINRYEVQIKETAAGEWVGNMAGLSANYQWRGLPRGIEFFVRVRGVDHYGNFGAWSDEASEIIVADADAPAAPAGLAVTSSVSNNFLSWTNPVADDVSKAEIWWGTTNVLASAALLDVVNAVPSQKGGYTHGGRTTGNNLYYWVYSIDTSGNRSAVPAGPANAITPYVVNADLAVGSLTGDRIQAGTFTGDRFNTLTSLPGTITIGITGVSIGTMQTQAADPAARINTATTLVDPGRIRLTAAGAVLTSWQNGANSTDINGARMGTGTLQANAMVLGLRGVTMTGIEFSANTPAANRVSWTAGTITYYNDSNQVVSVNIAAGNMAAAWTSGTVYFYWVKDATGISFNTAAATAYGANNIVLGTYRGGTALFVDYGRTIIEGPMIKTGAITSDKMSVGSLSAVSALIGTLRTATSGARMEIRDNIIEIFDASNVRRVRLGLW